MFVNCEMELVTNDKTPPPPQLPEIVVEFVDHHDKILNPHQRLLLEDTNRVKQKLLQLSKLHIGLMLYLLSLTV